MMALATCAECGGQVSSKAEKCPHCGAPRPKRTGAGTWIVTIVAGVVVVGCIAGIANAPSTAAKPQSPQQIAEERDFQTVVAGARWIRDNLKNPASFDLIAAGMVDGKTKAICYEYRARNSFNAVVLERRVIADKINSQAASDWNRYCAGKKATDFTHAREAL